MKKIVRKYGILFLIPIITVLFSSFPVFSEKRVKVVATYSIIADMVENVAGNKADVYSMVPIGVDPHSYDPTPKDVLAIEAADVVFSNGFNLEVGRGWFKKLLQNTQREELNFEVSEGVEPIYLQGEGSEREIDPHAWLNVQNGIIYVKNIAAALVKVNPENKEFYEKNRDAYIEKLEKLDADAKEKVSSLPEEKRFLITSEGAFKYFSKQYGFKSEYIWEINTDEQGSPAQMLRIIDIVKKNNIKALFVETSVSPKTMKAVARQTGAKIEAVIFTDSLAKKGKPGGTYQGMIEWNISKIVEGLGK